MCTVSDEEQEKASRLKDNHEAEHGRSGPLDPPRSMLDWRLTAWFSEPGAKPEAQHPISPIFGGSFGGGVSSFSGQTSKLEIADPNDMVNVVRRTHDTSQL